MQALPVHVKVLGLSHEQLKVVKGFQQESVMIRCGFKDHSKCCVKNELELDKTGYVEMNQKAVSAAPMRD